MYLSAEAIAHAVETLRNEVHPFFGITFLACKRARLPVGREKRGGIDFITRKFLDRHHKPVTESIFYFQPFRSVKFWVDQKYPSSGLQAINTQTFRQVFLHSRGAGWGFAQDYVPVITKRLIELGYKPKAPILSLAVWVYKDRDWDPNSTLDDVIGLFLHEFNISEEERSYLFYRDVHDSLLAPPAVFNSNGPNLDEALDRFPPPPDAPRELGGTLRSLRLEFVGPSDGMELDFGDRLTIITGDNGLGKSFLLETAWWATTGHWADEPAFPFLRDREYAPEDVTPSIECNVEDRRGRLIPERAEFDWRTNRWTVDEERQTVSALCVFARVDGSFAVFDPVRQSMDRAVGVAKFTQEELWEGSKATEGLVRDWVRWELSPDQTEFDRFKQLLKHLSPEDLGTLRPGKSTRLPRNPRVVPTIRHKYGETPILFASAGVKRILGIAYLIIWAWSEHRLAAQQTASDPLKKLVLFVDEVEAHLHPKWQRIVLPALLNLSDPVEDDLEVQLIAATHSPLVMASTEPFFNEGTDRLYHFELVDGAVELAPLEYAKFGDASSWLTSSAFDLEYARSREAQRAIERAKALQREESVSTEAVRRVSNELRRVLGPDDRFWHRWLYFAEQHDVRL